MTDHQAEVERLVAEYRRSREHLAATHRALATLSASESSLDGAITVTVGAQGVMTGLVIHPDTYRHYRPQQLADTIVRLTGLAARRATDQAARLIETALPAGSDPHAVLAGTADLHPEEVTPRPVVSDEADEEVHSWLEQAQGGGCS